MKKYSEKRLRRKHDAKVEKRCGEDEPEAKQAASYWLGLIAFEHGNYTKRLIDYFQYAHARSVARRHPWTAGATTIWPARWKPWAVPDDAVRYYKADLSPHAQHGNMLRAERLEAAKKPAAGKPPRKKAARQKLPSTRQRANS